MKLYNFSIYAKRRDDIRKAQEAAKEVVEVVANINQPGSIDKLKEKVDDWFVLHKEVAAG